MKSRLSHLIFAIGTCFHPVYQQKTPPLSKAISFTLSYKIICVLGIYISLYFSCTTLRMCIRHVFLCGFPFSNLNVTASSQHAEKKVMWACKIFCQHWGEKKKRKRMREEDKVFLHRPKTCTKPRALPRNKPQKQHDLSDSRVTTYLQPSISLAQ